MTRTFGVICAKPNKEDQMKKCILLTLIVLVPLLSGCGWIPDIGDLIPGEGEIIQGSGNVVTQDFDFTGFDEVEVSNAVTAEITQGGIFGVAVRIDDNLVEHLQVTKEGSTLRIRLKPGIVPLNATVEAEVTMPELVRLDVSGASQCTITGFSSTKALSVDVSGASGLMGGIEAGDARFDISGASHATLSGSAQDVTIDVSGASSLDLSAFPVADANVVASGASNVTVNASGRLDADASGASHVGYLGNPTLGTIDASDASSVEPE
jgi:hypothetical protein